VPLETATRVVDDDVDATELGNSPVYQRWQRVEVGDVGGVRQRSAPRGLDLLGDGLDFTRSAGRDGNRGAGTRKGAGDLGTDPAAAARDDRDAILQ
jgi:hypothetical protein